MLTDMLLSLPVNSWTRRLSVVYSQQLNAVTVTFSVERCRVSWCQVCYVSSVPTHTHTLSRSVLNVVMSVDVRSVMCHQCQHTHTHTQCCYCWVYCLCMSLSVSVAVVSIVIHLFTCGSFAVIDPPCVVVCKLVQAVLCCMRVCLSFTKEEEPFYRVCCVFDAITSLHPCLASCYRVQQFCQINIVISHVAKNCRILWLQSSVYAY